MNSDHIRFAVVTDNSPGSIESFVQSNVKRGKVLLTSGQSILGLTGTIARFSDGRELTTRKRQVLAFVAIGNVGITENSAARLSTICLNKFVDQRNNRGLPRQASFEAMIDLLLDHEPMGHWNLVGRETQKRHSNDPTSTASP